VLQEEEYQHHRSWEEETHMHQLEGKERDKKQINIWWNKKTSCINANKSSSTNILRHFWNLIAINIWWYKKTSCINANEC
jgi:hypothetical protein